MLDVRSIVANVTFVNSKVLLISTTVFPSRAEVERLVVKTNVCEDLDVLVGVLLLWALLRLQLADYGQERGEFGSEPRRCVCSAYPWYILW